MAEELLVITALSSEAIKAGEKLVNKLAEDIPVSGAFWVALDDMPSWRLYIATPLIKEKGPKYVYSAIQKSLTETVKKKQCFDLTSISAVDDENEIYKIIDESFGSYANKTGIKFGNDLLHGHQFFGGYMYNKSRLTGRCT